MFKKKSQLSVLEWEIMTVIWDLVKPVSVRDVLGTAYPNGEKAYTTVQTVMNNLTEKGFLSREKTGLVNFYRPLKAREEMVEKEVKRFAHKTFGGSLPALANFLIDSGSMTSEEIQELKHLIEQKEREEGNND